GLDDTSGTKAHRPAILPPTHRIRRQRMAIFLTNDDVRKLLPMDECVAVLEDLFRQEAAGLVENLARRRFRFGDATSAPPGPPATIMGGVALGSHAYGIRHNSV